MALAMESLGEEMRGVRPLRSVTTSRGLLQEMQARDGSALVWLDEFATLMNKKRQDFAADLLSRIVELYACPSTAGNYTGYDPIEVKNSFLSILSGSTVEWLRSGLTNNDLMAGLGNRMSFVLGDARKDNPMPKHPYWSGVKWDKLLRVQGEMTLEEDGLELWKKFYAKHSLRAKRAAPFTRVMNERVPEKVLKTAMVIAAWNGTKVIDVEILGWAIDWGEYLYESMIALTPAFEQADHQVLAAIKDGEDTRQQIFKVLGHTIPVKRLRESVDNLKWLGLLEQREVEGHLVPM